MFRYRSHSDESRRECSSFKPKTMKFRLRACAFHLIGSGLVAAAAWLLVFTVWYPSPLAYMLGGTGLFLLVVVVDVVMGPALTAVVASERKPRTEFRRDVSIIIALQLAAFAYGLHVMAQARPAVIAFEVDLFRLVAAAEVADEQLDLAPPGLQQLSWRGPVTLAAIKPSDEKEQFDTIQLGLAGIHLAALPRYWRHYDDHAGLAWESALPIAKVLNQQPNLKQEIDKIASHAKVDAASLRVLPLLARRVEGMVLLAPGGRVAGLLAATAPP